MSNDRFWDRLDALIQQSEIIIDRPRGTAHPRYPEYLYPLDSRITTALASARRISRLTRTAAKNKHAA